jgi:hypothetical protein
MGIAAVSYLYVLLMGVLVLFGVVITGIPAALLTLAMAGAYAWLARGLYQMRRGAWWGCLALSVIFGISGAVTYARIPLPRLLEIMNRAIPAQAGVGSEMQSILQGGFLPILFAFQVLFLGFILFVGRYIPAGHPPENPHPAETPDPI